MFDERLWKDSAGNAMPRRSPIPTNGEEPLDLSERDADLSANPARGLWIGNTAGTLYVKWVEGDGNFHPYPVAANSRFEGIIIGVGKASTCATVSPLR